MGAVLEKACIVKVSNLNYHDQPKNNHQCEPFFFLTGCLLFQDGACDVRVESAQAEWITDETDLQPALQGGIHGQKRWV